MTKQPTLKILVCYHKPAHLFKDEVFVPIHLGRSLATQASKDSTISEEDYQWMLDNMTGDDTGDNISYLNREFCEATALYWAWKNYDKLGNPDYIGLMPYRRHLCFDLTNEEKVEAKFGAIYNSKINSDYVKKYRLTEENIKNTIKNYDIITCEKEDVSLVGAQNVRDIWNINDKLHVEDIDYIVKKMGEMYPNYKEISQEYLTGSHAYLKNIIILKKEIFMEFCEMLFGVLFACKDLYKKYENPQERRVLAYMSEWLFGIYATKKARGGCKILELKRTFVNDTRDIGMIKNHLLISFDNNYYHYAYVLLNSIFQNNPQESFCIHVLYDKVKAKHIEGMTQWVERLGHRINFYYVDEKNFVFCPIKRGDKVTRSAYFRLFATQYLPQEIKKILYVDIDTLCLGSLKELFDTDMTDIPLMATYGWADDKRRKDLGLTPQDKYYQSGVLLINLEYWRQHNCIEGLTQFILEHKESLPRWDQDVINGYFKGKIEYLPLKYNVPSPFFHSNALYNPQPYFMQFLIADKYHAVETPIIIHFTGFDQMKPWWKDSIAEECRKNKWLFYRAGTPAEKIKLTRFYPKILKKIWCYEHTDAFIKICFLGIKIKLNRKLNIVEIGREISNVKTRIEASVIHPTTFHEFRNSNQGKDMVLCASGPTILHFDSSMIKNGKFLGVNTSIKKKDIAFDYVFLQDHHFEKGKNEFINEFDNGKCIKFYGKIESTRVTELDNDTRLHKMYECATHTHQLPFQDVMMTNARPYILSTYFNKMPYNIEVEPIADIGGTIFSAVQFALFTNPQRIFLVGCDHTSGYFYNQEFKMFNAAFQANVWVRCILPYLRQNYPHTQVISINPVGLKGLFEDVYTESYLKEHPEIKNYTLLKDIVGEDK